MFVSFFITFYFVRLNCASYIKTIKTQFCLTAAKIFIDMRVYFHTQTNLKAAIKQSGPLE